MIKDKRFYNVSIFWKDNMHTGTSSITKADAGFESHAHYILLELTEISLFFKSVLCILPQSSSFVRVHGFCPTMRLGVHTTV